MEHMEMSEANSLLNSLGNYFENTKGKLMDKIQMAQKDGWCVYNIYKLILWLDNTKEK